VVLLEPPDRAACARILDRHLAGLAPRVDTAAVAAALPPGVTGADLREVVRRAVLTHGRDLTTERVRAVVAEGRWQPAPMAGNYL
jgi:transitional endoplasmic reticulum ATPase